MSIQAYKVRALFKKDIKQTLKNGQFVLLAMLPIFFTVFYRSLDFGGEAMIPAFVLMMGTLMNLSLLPLSMMSMAIAEEKEKNTLRTLMLSNVSAGEFLLSKALVIFLAVIATNSVIFFAANVADVSFARFLATTAATGLCLMFLGAVVGILCRNQMSTGLLSAPIAMLMLLPAMLGDMNEDLARIARFTPTRAMSLLMAEESVAFSIAVLAGWMVLGAGLFAFFYHKKRLD